MEQDRTVTIARDVEASMIPVGTRVTIHQGESARITQALGGAYTVVVNGNMFRIEGADADALGIETESPSSTDRAPASPRTREEVEESIWAAMKTCYDPEIPVNVVDLGLIYKCEALPSESGTSYRVQVSMTLTAPGCGMGPMIQQDVHDKILSIEEVGDVQVDLVWEPQWNQDMIGEAAKLELGLM